MKRYLYLYVWIIMITLICSPAIASERWGTGALMVIIERENSSVVVVDSLEHKILGRISDLGLLHHATTSFSHDARYAYLVSRDGWLNKLDLLTLKRVAKVRVGDSAIGLAVTQDNRFVAVSNYKPPVVKIIDVKTMKVVHTILAQKEENGKKVTSRTIGMVDVPGNRLIFSLMDADGIWVVDASKKDFPVVKKFWDIGRMPYDALLTPDGRYYIAGLYHSPHLAMLDTWKLDQIKKISLIDPLKKTPKMGVRKVPHLEGWAMGNNLLFAPVVGEERLTVYKLGTWELIKSIPLAGIPMFAMSGPDGRHIWVNFSGTNNRFIQVVDSLTLKVIKTIEIGDRVFHMGFSPKGKNIYVSSYKDNKVVVLDTTTFHKVKELSVKNPSGVFSTVRAHIIGL